MNIGYLELITKMESIGFKVQEKEEYCTFKIIINNCRESKLYFREK
jgi:hypothetical protein